MKKFTGHFPVEAESVMSKTRAKGGKGDFNKSHESRTLARKMDEEKAKWKEMLGADAVDLMDEVEAEEQPLRTACEKVRLQSKVKGEFPCCEKCQHYIAPSNVFPLNSFQSVLGGVKITPMMQQQPESVNCDLGNKGTEIVYGVGEVYNPDFEVTICRHYVWGKK